jgi:hypothetical protein
MLVVKICTEPPPPLRNYRPDLPPEFEAVVGRMLAKNAEERFPNTQAVREALAPFRTFFGAPVLAEGVLPTAKIAPTQALSGVRHSSPTSAGNPSARTPVPSTTPVNVPMTNVATPASRFGTPVPSSDYAATTGFTPEKSKAPLFIGIGVALFVLLGIAAAVVFVIANGTGTTTAGNTTETQTTETPTMETVTMETPTMETATMETEGPETPTMETVEAAEQVRLIINVEPADAELFIDGASMGSNFNARVPANTVLRLEARREGYETKTQEFTPRFDGQVLTITLERGRGTPREGVNVTTMMSVTSMDVVETPMQVTPVETPMETPMVMEGFMDIML